MLKRIDPRHRCQEDLSWPDQLEPWSIAEQNVHEEWVPEHRSVLTILTWLKMPGHSQLRIRRSVLFSLCISMCEVWLAPATAVRGSGTGDNVNFLQNFKIIDTCPFFFLVENRG